MTTEPKVRCFKCGKWVRETDTKLVLYRQYNKKSASYRPACSKCRHIDEVLESKKINLKR